MTLLRLLNDDEARGVTLSLRAPLHRRPNIAQQQSFLRPCTTCTSLTVAARIRELVETGRAFRRAVK